MNDSLINLKNSIISSLEYAKKLPNSVRRDRELVASTKILNFINEKIKFNPEPFIIPRKSTLKESTEWISDIKQSTFLPKNKIESLIQNVPIQKVKKVEEMKPVEYAFDIPDDSNIKFEVKEEVDIREIVKRFIPKNVEIDLNLGEYSDYSWTK